MNKNVKFRMKLKKPTHSKFIYILLIMCIFFYSVIYIAAIPYGGIFAASCKWDCSWYQEIANTGYALQPKTFPLFQKGQANWAFFPLYPELMRSISLITHISTQKTGLIINLSLWPVLICLCIKDLEIRKIKVERNFLLLFFLLYPLNIWYFAQYSEGIYGVTMMAAICMLRQKKIYLAAIGCTLMSLARPTGFMMTCCLALWYVLQEEISWKDIRRDQTPIIGGMVLIAGGCLGLFSYMLFLHNLVGDGLAFVHIEAAWHRKFGFFLYNVVKAFTQKHLIKYALFAIVSFFILWKMASKKWALNAFLAGVTAFVALSTGVESFERYFFGNPLVIQYLAVTAAIGSKKRSYGFLGAMLFLHILTTILWFKQSGWVM